MISQNLINGNIQLYNTEDSSHVQVYDCIYYNNITVGNNETIPYCRRTKYDMLLNRSYQEHDCTHSGRSWSFKMLRQMNITQNEVLKWNSSIEMADRYAAYLITRNEWFDNDTICNCSLNTFGKFCEYKFLTMNTFEDTIQYQFVLKEKYQNGSQIWGNMTCYTTLTNCYSGLRCLTWQNICDGIQQCLNGIDEDQCDELAYNECEDNEYRCHDGSCISIDYWLDGDFDCSDRSDEQYSHIVFSTSTCPIQSYQFNCDETISSIEYFSCGDGEFIRNQLRTRNDCYNYRFHMFHCEPTMWTLENGHCVQYGWLEKNLTEMNKLEKCVFYLKCVLTYGKNIGCTTYAFTHFQSICNNQRINYPSSPVYTPYAQTIYDLTKLNRTHFPDVFLNGSIKCLGSKNSTELNKILVDWKNFTLNYPSDSLICDPTGRKFSNDEEAYKYCRNGIISSFLCRKNHQCIPRYRVHDGIQDCHYHWMGDEDTDEECEIKQKYRFNCLNGKKMCLLVDSLGDSFRHCQDGSDQYIASLKWMLYHYQCRIRHSIECRALKTYIQSPWSIETIKENKVILFREYCDTVWHLSMGFDESHCREWKCPRDEYQCLTNHCIPLKYLTNILERTWDCPDASDEIGLYRIKQLSEHNIKLLRNTNTPTLNILLNPIFKRIEHGIFPLFCNHTKEYGCLLAHVNEPLNFIVNRPCINLTQIGDGIIDCYGGLDERNLLICGNNTENQRGLDFHCNDQECIPFLQQCQQRCSNKADTLLCDQILTLVDSSCRNFSERGLCDGFLDSKCHHRLDEYYCDYIPGVNGFNVYQYRSHTWTRKLLLIYLPVYSESSNMSSIELIQTDDGDNVESHLISKEENNGREGWICGRGVAMIRTNNNTIQCFCPPSLYGEYCQYFSDRITMIISLKNIPLELVEQSSDIIKILVLFRSNDDIIDYNIFHLPLILSNELDKKFRLNFIYPRPKLPGKNYSIRFEAYHLSSSLSIKFLAVWEYLIHFPFLPSYRLAQVLNFESMVNNHICQRNNPCHRDSTCYPIMNQINQTSSYYCYCSKSSFGKQCQYQSSVQSIGCSTQAIQKTLSLSQSICLCPIHLYGPTCHLYHSCVHSNPCGINRGKCYINPDNLTYDYICRCKKKFFGSHCQFDSSVVKINFSNISFIQIPSNWIMSSIIQLCDLHNETLDLIVRQKRVYQGLPSSMTELFHNAFYLPILGILKLYHQQDLSNNYVANLKQPEYFMLYMIPSNVTQMNITMVINRTNYCPHTEIIFQKEIYDNQSLWKVLNSNDTLSSNISNNSILIFQYHLLCNIPYSLRCFHDDYYFCLCDIDNHAECSRFDKKLDECNGRCLTNGQCIRGDLDDRTDFICLCPRCYHGSVCQHNTQLFSFTLETLLTKDLYSTSVIAQRLFMSLLIIIPVIFLLIGTASNLCCYATFNEKKPLLVGAGHYLRAASIVNIITLFILLFKLLHVILSTKGYIVHHLLHTIFCKVFSYLLSCLIRICYWLPCMVAIERLYVTWSLKGTWLKKPYTAKRILIVIIIGIFVCNVHEAIYYQSIEDPKYSNINNGSWCVTSYPSIVSHYNQVNVTLNYILPFLINLISTGILMILITRKRAALNTKQNDVSNSAAMIDKSKFRSYIDLFVQNKDLILAPSVTMLPQLFSLPQLILSFSLACQEFNVNWQRYLLIISYFVLYLPQILFYHLYVSPSTFYKNEFGATKLGKKLTKWNS